LNSKITVNSKLTWSGKISACDAYLFPHEWNRFLVDAKMPDDGRPVLVPDVSVKQVRYKYKKQIEDELTSGNLEGTIAVGDTEIDWAWNPECYVDEKEVDLRDIMLEIDFDDVVERLLDGAEEGTADYQVEYIIQLDLKACSGKLAIGNVIIDTHSAPDVFVNCAFASDGKDVIFDDAGDLPESAAPEVKQEIIRMVSEA